jgi:peptidoglycan hydrolase-like protein with peptidoglycan-binding domain
MILLRYGTILPVVSTTQILLRRHQPHAEIQTDGHYGPKTTAAVQKFQKHHGLSADGIVGRFTWGKLGDVSGLQTIDVVDGTDPSLIELEATDIRNAGGDPIVLHGMSNGVAVAMNMIATRAKGAGTVALLRFHGHGGPGGQNVSAGDSADGAAHMAAIDVTNLPFILPALMSIRHVFAPFGSVQMHGCQVGGGKKGPVLLQSLANIWGVPVSAGINDQLGGGRNTFIFEGPVLHGFPSGGDLKSWSKGVQATHGNVCLPN